MMASRLININVTLIFLTLLIKSHAQNACHPNPCRNGFCTSNGYDFNCLCSDGYTGKRCDTLVTHTVQTYVPISHTVHPFVPVSHTVQPYNPITINTNHCSSSPCLYGGTCVNIPTAHVYPPFACVCPSGRTGLRCESAGHVTSIVVTGNYNHNKNGCLSSPCNQGTCLPNQQTGGYTCVCNSGYTGLVCNSPIHGTNQVIVNNNPCNSYPCRNGGICHNIGHSSYKCTCPVGYTGALCSYATATVHPTTNACSTNQCFYGGTCVSSSYHSYTCICAPGYTGPRCESTKYTSNACVSNPCHQGTCLPNQQTGGFTCVCNNGYTGIYCNQPISHVTYSPIIINPCHSNPCLYGGTCIPETDHTSFLCFCPVGYSGRYCGQISHTTIAPIYHTTIAPIYHTTIAPYNPCSRNPCLNSGYCVPNNNYGTYYCICTTSYFGQNCEQFVTTTTSRPNPCYINPCNNGGSCYPNANYNSYTCTCLPGYSGFNCDYHQTIPPTNPCIPNPCRNGQCTQSTYNSYQCVCNTNYFGTNCDQYISPTTIRPVTNICQPSPCLNGGVCVTQTYNTFTCVCPLNYQGSTCEFFVTTPSPNSCSPNPCFNGGNCVTLSQLTNGKYFACVCPPNFTGYNCETPQVVNTPSPIQGCNPNPCLYGGTCIANQYNGFVCNCRPGYTGTRCSLILSKQLDPCKSDPCKNEGVCKVDLGANSGFRCECKKGFIGFTCEQENLCESHFNACFNGGTCTTEFTESQYTVICQCPTGYIGSRCQILSNTGDNNKCFCKNNGVCQPDGTCRCLQDFYGIKCEFDFSQPETTETSIKTTEPPSTCPDGLCKNGVCKVTTTNTYFCYCNTGWTGVRCDLRINICQSANPCVNGVCNSEKNTNVYTCSCYTGFYGINCESGGPEDITTSLSPDSRNVCKDFDCLYGGTCFINTKLKAECQCRRGYIGLNCETDICLQKKLLGTCHDIITRYYYYKSSKACETFSYSGCNGNENNFEDLESCNKECSGH